jgi:hypothetical protein
MRIHADILRPNEGLSAQYLKMLEKYFKISIDKITAKEILCLCCESDVHHWEQIKQAIGEEGLSYP